MVLALNQAARIVSSRYVTEPYVSRQGAEERNSLSNQHRYASDNETLNLSRAQKPLNRDSTIDVEVVRATSCESRNNLRRSPGHLFNRPVDLSTVRGGVDKST